MVTKVGYTFSIFVLNKLFKEGLNQKPYVPYKDIALSKFQSGDLFQHTLSAKAISGDDQKVEPQYGQTHEIIFAKVYKYPFKWALLCKLQHMMYHGNKDFFPLFQKQSSTPKCIFHEHNFTKIFH